MYKFGQIEIESKKFNSEYKITSNVDLEKIRISNGVVANKYDTSYTVGYEVGQGKIISLNIKTPKDCASLGVSQFNESSLWKMGLNVSENKAWIKQYEAIWGKIEEILKQKLTGKPLSKGKYINPKLITCNEEIKTRFRGNSWNKPQDIRACHAIGVKIGSVYRKGINYHLQVFLKSVNMRREMLVL